MPYNTRRKSLSLPSLGIHVPVSNAARAAAAAAAASSKSASRTSPTSSASPPSASQSLSSESHPSKRLKKSNGDSHPVVLETTPPPSPPQAPGAELSATTSPPKVDLEGINDDIVEAVITQLQTTANRPHLIKDLATVLAQSLTSVQNSANQCAIISSRLGSFMKRNCWSASAPCPLAKELETVHPRRTYYFLTTFPRQPLPESGVIQSQQASRQQPRQPVAITPSVSLTDDSGSDDVEDRRRELSPSPELELAPTEFDGGSADIAMPSTPIGSKPKHPIRYFGANRHDLPPLEKDEREFTQTADGLQKRKLTHDLSLPDIAERNLPAEYNQRDADIWFGDDTFAAMLTSPAMKPSLASKSVKDDEADNWLKLNKLYQWDPTAETMEIDELEGLLDSC